MLSKEIVNKYVGDFPKANINHPDLKDSKWPKISSLADTVLRRLQDCSMRIGDLWDVDGARYDVDWEWKFNGSEYSTECARALVAAYRAINKTPFKIKASFGCGQLAGDYNAPLLVEIMELLNAVVLEADITNPIMHTVGLGEDKEEEKQQDSASDSQ